MNRVPSLSLKRGEAKPPQADNQHRKFGILDRLPDTQRSEQPPQSMGGMHGKGGGGGERKSELCPQLIGSHRNTRFNCLNLKKRLIQKIPISHTERASEAN